MTLNKFGLLKTTLLDYPGEVAATVFTPGCNLRCPFCHNPELLKAPFPDNLINYDDIMKYLDKRKNVLGGVCITGGEPLIHADIFKLIKDIKALGLKVKLDTNGTHPELLPEIDADFIAMDLKTSLKKYDLLVNKKIKNLSDKIAESVKIIMNLGIAYEFRTTVVPGLVDFSVIKEMIDLVKGASGLYVLAQYRPAKTLDPSYGNLKPYPVSELEKYCEEVIKSGIKCKIRTN